LLLLAAACSLLARCLLAAGPQLDDCDTFIIAAKGLQKDGHRAHNDAPLVLFLKVGLKVDFFRGFLGLFAGINLERESSGVPPTVPEF